MISNSFFTTDWPKQHVNFGVGTFSPDDSNASSAPSWLKTIKKQPFTKKLEVFFPVPDVGTGNKLSEVMEPHTKHFYAGKAVVSDFSSGDFMQHHVMRGECYALSINRRLDVDDVFAMYPDKTIHMSLQPDTHRSTSFKGVSKISKLSASHFEQEVSPIVRIQDISKNPTIQEPRKNIPSPEGYTVVMAWDNTRDEKTGEMEAASGELIGSLISHFPKPLKKLFLATERKTLRGLLVPIINPSDVLKQVTKVVKKELSRSRQKLFNMTQNVPVEEQTEAKTVSEPNIDVLEPLHEWIGALHNRIRSYLEGIEVASYVSVLKHDTLQSVNMFGVVFDYEGFITPNLVSQQVIQAKKIVDAGEAPFALITAWGFADVPGRRLDYAEEVHYTILLLPEDVYVTFKPQIM